MQWYLSSDPDWQYFAVYSETSVPNSYRVYTFAGAKESCDGGSTWAQRFPVQNTSYNTNHGHSGRAEGMFYGCGPTQFHVYGVGGVHQRNAWNGASTEGVGYTQPY